jgi:ABC-2 type transport system ATP-binding protein
MTACIETSKLTKTIRQVQAVCDLDLCVRPGQITGFLGRNGAGKSTTIKMPLGIVRPTSGAGTVLGCRIDDEQQSLKMRQQVAYVAEDKQLYAYFTVAEMIGFTRSFYSDWDANRERLLLDLYELPPKRKVHALSKGMRNWRRPER